ncbi:hypothetical protein ACWF9G_08760 [Nocardia sp. NPDC055029]|uniref:hypothetical protein n=1 Tax=Nocardia sp. NPDC060259 TaxID=3347088 RepID=UPI003655D060
MTTIRVTVPAEIAEALTGVPGVSPAPPRRSTWQIALSALTGATTVLTVLQAPSTFSDVSARIHKLLPRQATAEEEHTTITAKGPGGEVTLTLTEDVDVETIAQLLTKTLFPEAGEG